MITPIWYFGRRPGNSDRPFIEARMSVIPEKFQQRVANKYDKLYRSSKNGNRKLANTWLHKVAKRFRYGQQKKTMYTLQKIQRSR